MIAPARTPRPRSRTSLELQWHPADIRRRVRYFFFTQSHLRLAIAAAAIWGLFLLVAFGLAPGVFRGLWGHREYEALSQQRTLQGDRLQATVARLVRLRGASEDLRQQMTKIHLAYGLTTDESIGQGGYPVEPRPAPESIYAGVIRRGSRLESGVGEDLRVLEAFITEVQVFETEHREQTASIPSLSPLRGADFVLTSPFGTRRNPFTKAIDFHAGLDLAAPVGSPVYAPSGGRVVFAGRYPLSGSVAWWRYGNLVALRHGERFVTLYGHLDSIAVRVGQEIDQGDELGAVGNTGWSTSPHLHYEVRRRDDAGGFGPVDPRIYILDHRWRDEERILVSGRPAPEAGFEPLPPVIGR